MGDYTWAGVTFYAVPEADQRDVYEWLVEHDFLEKGDEVVLGEQLSVDQMAIGFPEDTAAEFARDHPNVVMTADQSGHYEYLPAHMSYVPGLGVHTGYDDNFGGDVLTYQTLEKLFEDLPEDATKEQIWGAIQHGAGVPWGKAIEKIQVEAGYDKKPDESYSDWANRLPRFTIDIEEA